MFSTGRIARNRQKLSNIEQKRQMRTHYLGPIRLSYGLVGFLLRMSRKLGGWIPRFVCSTLTSYARIPDPT
jgi:hypothetical protein